MSKIDEILQSDHTKGSHADDFSDREPCLCQSKAELLQRVLEVIGEPRDDDRAYSADILKQQQRKRVYELFGVDK